MSFSNQASHLLRKLYTRHIVRKYVKGMTAQRKAQVILIIIGTPHTYMYILLPHPVDRTSLRYKGVSVYRHNSW